MRTLALLLITIALLLTSGCKRAAVRPDLPTGPATVPELLLVDRKVYVPIPAELTRERPIAEGSIAQCFEVGAARKAELTDEISASQRS